MLPTPNTVTHAEVGRQPDHREHWTLKVLKEIRQVEEPPPAMLPTPNTGTRTITGRMPTLSGEHWNMNVVKEIRQVEEVSVPEGQPEVEAPQPKPKLLPTPRTTQRCWAGAANPDYDDHWDVKVLKEIQNNRPEDVPMGTEVESAAAKPMPLAQHRPLQCRTSSAPPLSCPRTSRSRSRCPCSGPCWHI